MAKASKATLQARGETLAKESERRQLEEHLQDLATYLVKAVPGSHPRPGESTVDVAIRILNDLQAAQGLNTSTIASLERRIAEGTEQNKRLIAGAEESNQRRHAAEVAKDNANKERDAALEENNILRDRLHQSELQVARLEGMLERVREFDPVSDRDVYEDGKPRHEPPPMRSFDGAMSGRRPPRWYDRQREVA